MACREAIGHFPRLETKAMATDLEPAASESLDELEADVPLGDGDAVVIHGISWRMYRKLRRMRENSNIRLTYDRGDLEIMSPSPEHEGVAELLGSLVTLWALEFNIPIRSCGRMTIRRSILERGFEPDNCYYVQHEPQMWNKRKIDFKTDPPPDLAIEVEITRKLIDKTRIYAAFGVPELWRWRRRVLTVHELSERGEYVPRDASICLPGFPIAKAQAAVRQLGAAHETDILSSFRDWVRANAQPGG
jgi:Uma2 family endonuclease